MTTVAFDGTYLAVDSRRTCNDVVIEVANKLFLEGGMWFTGTGETQEIVIAARWLAKMYARGNGGIPPEPTLSAGIGIVMIDDAIPAKVWHFSQELTVRRELTGMYAMGSGAELAYGAMEAGANAAMAVEIACRRDVYSGLPVHWISIKSGDYGSLKS